MKRANSVRARTAAEIFLLVLCFSLPVASPARADKKFDAREQFMRAVKLRTALEGQPQKDRTLSDYKQAINAYHKVYLVSPQAEEVTPSLIAEAELYGEMGRLYDPKYFGNAIECYNFLLKQYPGSRYRAEAIFTIGLIQKNDLNQPDAAEATLKEFVRRFPTSDKAPAAREFLKEIAQERELAKQQAIEAQKAAAAAAAAAAATAAASEKAASETDVLPAIKGQVVEQKEASGGRIPHVTNIRTWNAENQTRIVVTLEDTIKYEAVRIANPERIYFDLYKAQVPPKFANKSLEVQEGLLKSGRIAQNKPTVARLVLDVGGAKDYSAYLLSNPYRLVIEVRSSNASAAKTSPAPNPATEKTDAVKSDPKPAEKIPVAVTTVVAGKSADPSKSDATPVAKTASAKSKPETSKTAALKPPPEPKPTRDGQRSLTRALGLKISRIVIDPGHGGHDTGTIGPHGLMEKDLCLDVATRLGNLIEDKIPGAEVVYTRRDDTFIALEDRTAIANNAKADLFISIHANSSHNQTTRGIETYYLNFSASAESMEVAARENALSQESLHDLQDLIKRIARNEKIEESKELATDIQDSLSQRLQVVSQNERNRGVKKAPFIVLIGANMPSVLTEISFLSNPNDERLLRKGDQRQRVAEGLYRGIASYLENLNSLSYDRSKLISENQAASTTAGNHK
jgi:N-acetylmuramoyl-L-alanine amidase